MVYHFYEVLIDLFKKVLSPRQTLRKYVVLQRRKKKKNDIFAGKCVCKNFAVTDANNKINALFFLIV